MIIGNGMLALAFETYQSDKNFVVFASGVSNSRETKKECFERERNLLSETLRKYPTSIFVYFGTCSIYDPSVEKTPYVQHKVEMEKLVQSSAKRFFIFRLPQIIGSTSSPTIINYLYKKIAAEAHFDLWENSERNLIDIQDVTEICQMRLQTCSGLNEITNVAAPTNTKIRDLVEVIETFVGKKAIFSAHPIGDSYEIDTSKISSDLAHKNFDSDYILRTIKKYYQPAPKLDTIVSKR